MKEIFQNMKWKQFQNCVKPCEEKDWTPVGDMDTLTKEVYLSEIRAGQLAGHRGDWGTAAQHYTEALLRDPDNYFLLANRSAAFTKNGEFAAGLQDAIRARELAPNWPKAYYRQGAALEGLGRHADALAAYASGLAEDPKCASLLMSFVEAAKRSPLCKNMEPVFKQIQTMKMDHSSFMMLSAIGQEVLNARHNEAAVVVLECALRVGTPSLKLRSSVLSALASAYWALNHVDRAMACMQEDLAVAHSLGDRAGECRANGNLGAAHFSKGNYQEALACHTSQLDLATKCQDPHAAMSALTSLGHVYTAIGDHPNALASHRQCGELANKLGDRLQEAREAGNVGAVFLAMGDYDRAIDHHQRHLTLAQQLGLRGEEARAHGSLGSAHHCRRDYEQATVHHSHVLEIALELGDKALEARAYAGLGHAARCMGDYTQAKKWHEKQLDVALSTKNKVAEGRACSNLGIIYQLMGDYDAARKLHQAHLNIARSLGDRAGMGRAYGNLGNAVSAMGQYEEAVKHHKQELTISKEVGDRSAEAATHGNLAVAYQALAMHDMALVHYRSHLRLAQEIKDTAAEACALLNLANCHSSRGEFSQALPFYESYLKLATDAESESKGCHFLGYAHYCLNNYAESIQYYERGLTLAQELQDKGSTARAYCNLGLAHLALGHLEPALQCQRAFLSLAATLQGKFRALGNVGSVLMKMGQLEEASKSYQRQLQLARQGHDRGLEAAAHGALGQCYLSMECYDKALAHHTQELMIRQESGGGDVRGECRAHSHLGAVHLALGAVSQAARCYEEQFERAREAGPTGGGDLLQAHALANLAVARLRAGRHDDAIACLEQQLGMLAPHPRSAPAQARAHGTLGDCYDALGDHEEAAKCYRRYLELSADSPRDMERALRSLGHCYRRLGQLQQALVCFEKRLVVCHELGGDSGKAAAYGDLGTVHRELGHHEQAVACLEQQMALAGGDPKAEAAAAGGLGAVFQKAGEPERALPLHSLALKLALQAGDLLAQAEAHHNLGLAHETLGSLTQALPCLESFLGLATQLGDRVSKMAAYVSLGRVHRALGNVSQAVSYLQQGLQLSGEPPGREELELRHQLGLALWESSDLPGAQLHLAAAADLAVSLGSPSTAPVCQTLQRVLLEMRRELEALVAAERSRTSSAVTEKRVLEILNNQPATVLYYSILPEGRLYLWVLVPEKGLVKFHQSNMGGEVGPLVSRLREALDLEEDLRTTPQDDVPRLSQRNQLLNSSNYSLSSLFSVGSAGSVPASRAGSVRSQRSIWPGPAPLHSLFELLISPAEEHLTGARELVLVLDGDQLPTVPFAMLKGNSSGEEYLCERFSLTVASSLSSLVKPPVTHRRPRGMLIVGAEEDSESQMAAELLGCEEPLLGPNATKGAVMRGLVRAECAHISASCTEQGLQLPSGELLSPSDLRTSARLIVLSPRTATNNLTFAQSLLAAGAQCVVAPLWPTPETAARLFFRTFYSSLLQGSKASIALVEAMRTIQSTKQLGHPANWAGFSIIGRGEVRLHGARPAQVGPALAMLIAGGERCRDALRVCLHLVEKSLQRITRGQRNAMYTAQRSIENKVGGSAACAGWRELLSAVGFRFEPAANGLPAAVFFPQSDCNERLSHCSDALQALLGLPTVALTSLAKLLDNPDPAQHLITLMEGMAEDTLAVGVRLWNIAGSHELLASMGFDLVEVGQDCVTLRLGPQANERVVSSGLTALRALFDTPECSNLELGDSSSLESLESAPSASPEPPPSPPRFSGAFRSYVQGDNAFTPSPVAHKLLHKLPQCSSSSGSEHENGFCTVLRNPVDSSTLPSEEIMGPHKKWYEPCKLPIPKKLFPSPPNKLLEEKWYESPPSPTKGFDPPATTEKWYEAPDIPSSRFDHTIPPRATTKLYEVSAPPKRKTYETKAEVHHPTPAESTNLMSPTLRHLGSQDELATSYYQERPLGLAPSLFTMLEKDHTLLLQADNVEEDSPPEMFKDSQDAPEAVSTVKRKTNGIVLNSSSC